MSFPLLAVNKWLELHLLLRVELHQSMKTIHKFDEVKINFKKSNLEQVCGPLVDKSKKLTCLINASFRQYIVGLTSKL